MWITTLLLLITGFGHGNLSKTTAGVLLLIVLPFQPAFSCAESLIPECSNGVYGYRDDCGQWIITPRWHSAEEFRCGKVACVSLEYPANEQKYGLIDANGEYIIQPIYDYVIGFESEEYLGGAEDGYYYVSVWDDGELLTGLFDVKFMTFVEPIYKEVIIGKRNPENLVLVQDASTYLWGYVDTRTGKHVIPCIYDEGGVFSEGYALCIMPGSNTPVHVIIKSDGSYVEVPNGLYFLQGEAFNSGLALVCNEFGRYGYINFEAQLVIPCIYENALAFHAGKAAVYFNDEWHIIDTGGATVH